MPLQEYGPQMKALMLAIGKRMSINPEKWIETTWISRQSSLYDFGLSDRDNNDILAECGCTPVREMNLGRLADTIHTLPVPLKFG